MADWYPDKEKALLKAIKSKKPFTTGWYSSKKEIASARITRMADGKFLVETSVADDFDTPGKESVIFSVEDAGKFTVMDMIRDNIYHAWDMAQDDQKANRVYIGFSIHAPTRVYSCYVGGKPEGKGHILDAWVETYIRQKVADNDGFEADCFGVMEWPPGDNYHKWGWQGDKYIPKPIKKQLEKWAEDYRPGQKAKELKVGRWTIKPWEEDED